MATSKKSFIDVELGFAEEQLRGWKTYMEANPIHELKDRLSFKETKNGGMIPMVVASIEQQGKFLQETLKNYLLLSAEVEKLREKEEEKKIQARGTQDLSSFETGEFD